MDQELLKKQLEQAATAALYQQLQMRFQHINRYQPLTINESAVQVMYMWFGFVRDAFVFQVWGDWDACDEQVHVSARHRALVGHAYLSLSAVRYHQLH